MAKEVSKQRAGRNRTLTVSESEKSTLSRLIMSSDDLARGYQEDSLVNGNLFDCIESLPNDYFDLLIIDPPYNLDKDFNGNKFSIMDSSSYEDYLRSWFYDICEKLKPDGTLYMCGDWRCSSSMQRVIEKKLTIINRITWQREKGRGAKGNWKNGMEDIWYAVKNPKQYYFDVESVKLKRKVIAPYKVNGKPKDWEESNDGNFRVTYPSNFWDDISIPFWSMPENTDHPTQKPEKLYAKLILASSRPGARILDPFLGSGTSAVVAKKLGRHYCGIEINREYCYWAAKRIVRAEEDKSIQGYTDGVFWERNSLNYQRKTQRTQVHSFDLFDDLK